MEYKIGERVRFIEKGWDENDEFQTGQEGVVTDSFCEYGDHRLGVLFDGHQRVAELPESYFEPVDDHYEYIVERTDETGSRLIGSWTDRGMANTLFGATEVTRRAYEERGIVYGCTFKIKKRLKAGEVVDV